METRTRARCSATRPPSGGVVMIGGYEFLDEVCGARLEDAMVAAGVAPLSASFAQVREAAAAAVGSHECGYGVPLHRGPHRCRCGLEW